MSTVWSAVEVTVRREAIQSGDRELRRTTRRFGDDFRELRLRVGVSQATVARAIGVHRDVISRIELGDTGVGPAIRSRACACLGADFRIQLYRERTPLIFDAAHARIVERVLAARHRTWRATTEAVVPGPGRRSVDIRLERGHDVVLVEVETRLRRLEEIIRELHAKRDAAIAGGPAQRRVHVVLVLPPTRHHRAIARSHPASMKAAFPIASPALLESLRSPSETWPGDGILWVAGSQVPGSRPGDGASSVSCQKRQTR